MGDAIRLRKMLSADMQVPIWPTGTRRLALPVANPRALHPILANAYSNGFGQVPPFEEWWSSLNEDAEFDPALFMIAATEEGEPIGLVQGWTSAFIKDFAVVPSWRRKGVGEALLLSIFHAYHLRGASFVDLKVVKDNAVAINFYSRLGMIEATL